MKTLLISAYGCNPLKGSVAGVGWNWVLEMVKNNKLFNSLINIVPIFVSSDASQAPDAICKKAVTLIIDK